MRASNNIEQIFFLDMKRNSGGKRAHFSVVAAVQHIDVAENLRGQVRADALNNALTGARELTQRLVKEHTRAEEAVKLAIDAANGDQAARATLFEAGSVRDLLTNTALSAEHYERRLFLQLADLNIVRTVVQVVMRYGGELLLEYLRVLGAMTLPPVSDLATYARQADAVQRIKRTIANDHFMGWLVSAVAPVAGQRLIDSDSDGDGDDKGAAAAAAAAAGGDGDAGRMDRDGRRLINVVLTFFNNMLQASNKETSEAVVGCMCRTHCFDLLLVILEQNRDAHADLVAALARYVTGLDGRVMRIERGAEGDEDGNDAAAESFVRLLDDEDAAVAQRSSARRGVGMSDEEVLALPLDGVGERRPSSTLRHGQQQTPSRRAAQQRDTPGRSTSKAVSAAGDDGDMRLPIPFPVDGSSNNNGGAAGGGLQPSPQRRRTAEQVEMLVMQASPRKHLTPSRSMPAAAAAANGGQQVSPFRANQQQQQEHGIVPPVSIFSPRKPDPSNPRASMGGEGAQQQQKKSESPAVGVVRLDDTSNNNSNLVFAAAGGTPQRALAPPLDAGRKVAARMETQLVILDDAMLELSDDVAAAPTDAMRTPSKQQQEQGRDTSESTSLGQVSASRSRDRSASIHVPGGPAAITTEMLLGRPSANAAAGGSTGPRVHSESAAAAAAADAVFRTAEEKAQHQAAVDAALRFDEDEVEVEQAPAEEQQQTPATEGAQDGRDSSSSSDDDDDDDDDDEEEDEDDDGLVVLGDALGERGSRSAARFDDAHTRELEWRRRKHELVADLDTVRRWNLTILGIFSSAFLLAPAAAIATWNHPLIAREQRGRTLQREIEERKRAGGRALLDQTRRNQGPVASAGLIVRRVEGEPRKLAPGLITSKDRAAEEEQRAEELRQRKDRPTGDGGEDAVGAGVVDDYGAGGGNAASANALMHARRKAFVAVGSVTAILGSRHEDQAALRVDRGKKPRITKAMLLQPLVSIVTMPLTTQKQLAAQFQSFSQHGFLMLSEMVWTQVSECIEHVHTARADTRGDKGMSIRESMEDLSRASGDGAARLKDTMSYFALATVLLRFGRTGINLLAAVRARRELDRLNGEAQLAWYQERRTQLAEEARAEHGDEDAGFGGFATPGRQQQQLAFMNPEAQDVERKIAALRRDIETSERDLATLEQLAEEQRRQAQPVVSELLVLGRIQRAFDFMADIVESKELRNDGWSATPVAEFLAETLRLLVHSIDRELVDDDGVATAGLSMAVKISHGTQYMRSVMQLVRFHTNKGRPPGEVIEPLLRLLHAKFLLLDRAAQGSGTVQVQKREFRGARGKKGAAAGPLAEEAEMEQQHDGRRSTSSSRARSASERRVGDEEPPVIAATATGGEDEDEGAAVAAAAAAAAASREDQEAAVSMILCTAEGEPVVEQHESKKEKRRRDKKRRHNVDEAAARKSSDEEDEDAMIEAVSRQFIDEATDSDESNAGDEIAAIAAAAAARDKKVHLVDYFVELTQGKQMQLFAAAIENWRTLAADAADALGYFLTQLVAGSLPEHYKVLFHANMLVHLVDIYLNAGAADEYRALYLVARTLLLHFFCVEGRDELALRVTRSIVALDPFEYSRVEEAAEDALMRAAAGNVADFYATSASLAARRARKRENEQRKRAGQQPLGRKRGAGAASGAGGKRRKRGANDESASDNASNDGDEDDLDADPEFMEVPDDEELEAERLKREIRAEKKERKRAEKRSKKEGRHAQQQQPQQKRTHVNDNDDDDDMMAGFSVAAALATTSTGAPRVDPASIVIGSSAVSGSPAEDGAAAAAASSSSQPGDGDDDDADGGKRSKRDKKRDKKEKRRQKKLDKKERRQLKKQSQLSNADDAAASDSSASDNDGDENDETRRQIEELLLENPSLAGIASSLPAEHSAQARDSGEGSGAKMHDDEDGGAAPLPPRQQQQQPPKAAFEVRETARRLDIME